MDILVVGLNHKRAPVELRERIAFPQDTLPDALRQLDQPEGLILSTCNRVEIYAATENSGSAVGEVSRFLAEHHGLEPASIEEFLYRHQGEEAVRHLFRVASGLDAMVVGETQILAQVKEAYQTALAENRTGKILNPLFQRSLHTAKRVHTETTIGEKHVSVSSVAADLASNIFQNLAQKSLLILGAGETGELTLQAFRDRGVGGILIANRTPEKARRLAEQFGGKPHDLTDLPALLPRADIIITCVSAEEHILDKPGMIAAQKARRNAPTFVIDIAVPRNTHPDVGSLDNVYLYNIDDLQAIVNENLTERTKEMKRCEPIIEEEAASFMREIATVDVGGLLRVLREHVETIGNEELKRTLGRLDAVPPEQTREEVRNLVHRIVGKILHSPSAALRREAADGKARSLISLTKRLFGIK